MNETVLLLFGIAIGLAVVAIRWKCYALSVAISAVAAAILMML